MIEKGKISASQMGILMIPTILATALLILPSIIAVEAGRDLWLSPIWSSLIGIITVFIAVQLNKHFPNETIIEYSPQIIGKFFGKLIGIIYIFFYLHVNGIILREYMEFIKGAFYTQTPDVVILGTMAFVCAFAVYGGIEVIARSGQLFIPIILIFWVISVVLLSTEFEFSNILPIFEKGIMPSLKGAASPQGWFSEYFLIAFLLPYLGDRQNGLKWGMLSVIIVMLIMVITNIATLLVFGDMTTILNYPFMDAVAYISIADFLQHLDPFIMTIWIAGTFIKISVFHYAFVLSTAQWLKVSDFRPLVVPLTFLLVVFAKWSALNFAELKDILKGLIPFYLTSVQTILPLLLLLIVFFQKKYKSRANQ